MSHTLPSIAILGAGRVGSSLARSAVAAGYEVKVAGSGAVDKIALTAEILMPGAVPSTADQAVKDADIVFLAVPLHKFRSVDPATLEGKIVIDTMNHWVPVNGELEEIDQDPRSTSEIIAEFFAGSTMVKSFNHIGYHEIEQDAGTGRAIAYATDDVDAGAQVAQLIESFGFVPLNIGALENGRILEPGQEAFGAHLTKDSRLELVSQR